MKIWGGLLVALAMILPAALAAQTDVTTIRMAVRDDVPPFIWKDPASGHFRGFFWDICTVALVRAGYDRETVQITAAQRAELLNTGSYPDKTCADGATCTGPRATVDLLCDPTTITLARMETFALGKEKDAPAPKNDDVRRFVFSPILFLANGSYIQQTFSRQSFRERMEPVLSNRCQDYPALAPIFHCDDPSLKSSNWLWLVPPNARTPKTKPTPIRWDAACKAIGEALDGGPNAAPKQKDPERSVWPPKIWPEPDPEKPQFEIWGYVKGATIGPAVVEASNRAPQTVGICTQSFDSHTDAVEAFCSGRIYRYFGDVDLVRARVEAYRTAKKTKCAADETPSTRGTYEPYAMVLSDAKEGFPEAFSLALYSMFTDGTVRQLFNGRFGANRRSQYLDTLYSINSIPSGSRPTEKTE